MDGLSDLVVVLPIVVAAALLVLFVRYSRTRGARPFEALAERLGLRLVTPSNMMGVKMIPFVEGDYRGREVFIKNDLHRHELRAYAGELRSRLASPPKGQLREQLLPPHIKAFSYTGVACANPSNLAFRIQASRPTRGPDGAVDFRQSFHVSTSPGHEHLVAAVLTEAHRQELVRTLTSRFLQPFHALTLAGPSLFYIENHWVRKAEDVERLSRMVDLLCEVATRVESVQTVPSDALE